MSGLLDRDRTRIMTNVRAEADDIVLAAVRAAARQHGVWVELGSLAISVGEDRLGAPRRTDLAQPGEQVFGLADLLRPPDNPADEAIDLRGGKHVEGAFAFLPALHFRRTGLGDGQPRKHDGRQEGARQDDAPHLLEHDHEIDESEPDAAVFLGQDEPQPAEIGHLLHRGPRELRRGVRGAGDGGDLVAREVAHHLAHLAVLVGEEEGVVHGERM
jgi:hypothetical protein